MSSSLPRPVRIRYRRPPDREDVFLQTLVHEGDSGLVTLMPAAGVTRPTVVAGRTVLESGAPVVWFTFPGLRHDIGRFHTADGTFTGVYANILTPVQRDGDTWTTTDLFLDVFVDLDGEPHVLDRSELEEAVDRGWVEPDTARGAEREASRLVAGVRAGTWPPPIVDAWPLDRARDAARGVTD